MATATVERVGIKEGSEDHSRADCFAALVSTDADSGDQAKGLPRRSSMEILTNAPPGGILSTWGMLLLTYCCIRTIRLRYASHNCESRAKKCQSISVNAVLFAGLVHSSLLPLVEPSLIFSSILSVALPVFQSGSFQRWRLAFFTWISFRFDQPHSASILQCSMGQHVHQSATSAAADITTTTNTTDITSSTIILDRTYATTC